MINFIWYVRTAVPLCQQLLKLRRELLEELRCRRSIYALFKNLDSGNKGYLDSEDLTEHILGHTHSKDSLSIAHLMNPCGLVSYIDFYNYLFDNLHEDIPECCGRKGDRTSKQARKILRELFFQEIEYTEKVAAVAAGIGDLDFEAIYSTFVRLDEKGVMMINAESLAKQMFEATHDRYTEEQITPFIFREFGSEVISFPEFYQFFERVRKKKIEMHRKRTKKQFSQQPYVGREESTPKKIVQFQNDAIKTVQKQHDLSKKKSTSKKKKRRRNITITDETRSRDNRFLKYFRSGQAAKQARKSCQRFLRYRSDFYR